MSGANGIGVAQEATGASISRTSRRLRLGSGAREAIPLAVALILVSVVFQLSSGLFLDPRNLTNLLVQLAPLGLIAIGSTVMIVMGEIDLSLGSIAGLSGAIAAVLLANDGMPWVIALLLTFSAAVAIEGAQGLIVVIGRVRSFAVTLAGFLIWYGVQIAILGPNGQEVVRRDPVAQLSFARFPTPVSLACVVAIGLVAGGWWVLGTIRRDRRRGIVRLVACALVVTVLCGAVLYLSAGGGVPVIFLLVLAVTAVMWFILTRMAFGRHLYAVGGDLEAAREAGVDVTRVKWVGFLFAGAFAAFAGLSIVSYTGGADTSTGTGTLLLAAIGATVVGGVSLMGGRGSIWGAFGGAVLLASVQNGLNLLNLPFYAVYVVEGLVVLAALLADAGLRRRLVTQ